MKTGFIISMAIGVLVLTGCETTSYEDTQSPSEKITAINNALSSAERPLKDKADDAARKPAEVLAFSGVKSGDFVVEMEAGSGYYTEILSRIVGSDGKIYMQNPAGFDAFISQEVYDARLGKNQLRLTNVEFSKSNFDDLSVPSASSDLVTWILGPHELWLANKDGELTLGDPDKTYAEIVRVLKPGGYFMALDHASAAGDPESTGGDTHRIDPKTVRIRAEAAGLKFVRASDILANPADNYTVNVFDPSVRRKTDRFLHLYVKPR